ncbi:hypothetical protein C4544_00965 [candidate division WS5 bacterium]|uniref:Uncharacterized protein n=1 Tax=candidate division WS5 bacterium TaxID=2093353 RepID=A0A419DG49_9BACT|nr:MAG: hypothetical protein C4544_00965 [candidate division WS5 bacterium]
MYCPKCGQVTVHLNGRDICTKCGIVFDNDLPKEQILRQIRSKIAKTQARGTQDESYTSPIAVASKNPVLPKESSPSIVVADRTVGEIQRDTRLGKEAAEAKEEAQATQSAKSTPNLPGPTIYDFGETASASLSEQQSVPLQNTDVSASADSPAAQGNIIQNQQAVYQGANTAGSETIYPSHEVNPILIKIFISVFSILVFFVIVYILYANFSAAKGMIDNIIRFLGERVF